MNTLGLVELQKEVARLNKKICCIAAGAETDSDLIAMRLLGGSIKAEIIGASITNVITGVNPADTTMTIVGNYLPTSTTLTGVKWFQVIAGDYTADNYNGFGLFKYSEGTCTLVASTTNDGNIFKAVANTWNSKAFTTPYVAAEGVYFVAALYNYSAQVTIPSLGGCSAASNAAFQTVDFTNSAKLSSILAGQSTLPTSFVMSATTGITGRPYFALY